MLIFRLGKHFSGDNKQRREKLKINFLKSREKELDRAWSDQGEKIVFAFIDKFKFLKYFQNFNDKRNQWNKIIKAACQSKSWKRGLGPTLSIKKRFNKHHNKRSY